MNMNRNQYLTIALLEGRITRDEERELAQYLHSDATAKDSMHVWDQEWQQLEHQDERVDAMWNKFQQRITTPQTKRIIPMYRRAIRWAAACIVLAVLSVAGVQVVRMYQQPESIVTESGAAITEVALPDGTRVVLNQSSSLTYACEDGRVRRVKLIGEAYFEVKKDPTRPFVVYADGVQVKVTGTHFNVAAYPTDAQCRTTLLEGSVTVSNDQFTSDLVPGDQLTYTSATGAIVKDKCNTEAAIAWMQGRMDYSQIQLGELMGRLSRMYGCEIAMKNTVAAGLDVHFVMNDTLPLRDVLEAFATAYHLNVQTTSDGYIIN